MLYECMFENTVAILKEESLKKAPEERFYKI